jgi:uncharacterized protein DUF5947
VTRSLRRLLRDPPAAPEQRCELCAAPVTDEHAHLVEVEQRRLLCSCAPCALLFSDPDRPLRYRRVPDRYLVDPGFALSDEQWDALRIPVGMAFFLRNSARDGVIACYPSPAGATESELTLDAWSDGVGAGALAAELAPDVEALLVRRPETGGHGQGAAECLLVPIDACYRLVGLVRLRWKGFDGGAEAWDAIDAFFDDARSRARTLDRS